ncbi:MAG: hypothetical protein AAFP03_07890 [Cyanobacteria bacterium J06598_3]
MVDINFTLASQFKGAIGGPNVLANPTSLQFGPDERLYVTEQNGTINAFTIAVQNDQYIATSVEEINLVKSIQNHNDNGSLNNNPNRQVTGIIITGTAQNPVLYVSSSDPRIATNGEVNIDTNSGVITRLTWTGNAWDAVDIVRGLPRSEENHSTNGLILSPDGSKLYVAQGGNTNNGAPSQFFSYTGEYALSGTVLEIDLNDINSRPVLTDPGGGQNGTSRQYIYNLPTLDDPSVANNGVQENVNGLDVNGPWGGNDGLNMSILPADAPLRIYADGLRNHYDLAITQSGQLYTVDNGSNNNLGGEPIVGSDGQATNQPNNSGPGDPEPLFLLQDGGYYGHPNPARSNQDLAWVVYDDSGNPDGAIAPNTAANLSALVPSSLAIQDGFLIDPSKFTGNANRLAQSGVRVERSSPQSNALATLGSSSNGLVEYTGNAFDGALNGALLVTQFNGNVTALNLNNAGNGLAPLIGPGNDGLLGTSDDETVDADGVYPLLGGFSQALDVTVGPNGSIWVAEIGADFIKAFAPVNTPDTPPPVNDDFDNDGLVNTVDPFIRDAANGTGTPLQPGQTLLWDFDANQDNNLPGPDGYGGGLTGVMLDGTTDFEAFFQQPSTLANQDVKLDNVKFITAAGGGTTVVENVSNGDAFAASNDGEYLFHTGLQIAPTVEEFTVQWSVFNPGLELGNDFQQIGGYLGTGDQNNYLKLVAIQHPDGEIEMLLEDGDTVQAQSYLQADDLLAGVTPSSQKILLELTVDPTAATATPTVTYETTSGDKTVTGTAMSLAGTAVLAAIEGSYTVQGQASGLAVGLFSSNTGAPASDTFQAIFDGIEVTAAGGSTPPPPDPPAGSEVLYRVNAGGAQVAATDGGPAWSADTPGNNSEFLSNAGSNNIFAVAGPIDSLLLSDTGIPDSALSVERWDKPGNSEMAWAFEVAAGTSVHVNLYLAENYLNVPDVNGDGAPTGDRVFDVSVDGSVPAAFNDLDAYAIAGNAFNTGISVSHTLVSDGIVDLSFIHGLENPAIKAIEIVTV